MYKDKILLEVNKQLKEIPDQQKNKVKNLLNLKQDELLDEIQKKVFNYFWEEADEITGLIKDRKSKDSYASIAATGFGLTVIPAAVNRGWLEEKKGFNRILSTLRAIDQIVDGKNGFYYHFVDSSNGNRSRQCELSSIDTALLLAGALFAGQYYKNTEIEELADKLYRKANWSWMLNSGETLCMGWTPEQGFEEARWDHFDEGLLAYILGIGAPHYTLSTNSWHQIKRPVKNNRIYLPSEPLFIYLYPQVWVDFRNKKDDYVNYWENTKKAVYYNYSFCKKKKNQYKTYSKDIWGLSACDGPDGYHAYGAVEGNHDGTIAPYAALSSLPYEPKLSFNFIRTALDIYGPLIWGKYGFVSGFNLDKGWFSKDYIGIDQGTLFLMIENYRSSLIWKYFMRNNYIKKAMKKIGFRKQKEKDNDPN